MANRLGNAFTLAAMTLTLSTAASAVDVVGTSVSLGWSAATGPVSGYYVIVSRNSAAAKVESVTTATAKTLTGAIGETLVVQVAAFAPDGVAGPVSPASDPIKFVSSTGSGSGGGTTPPPPDPDPAPTTPAVVRDFTGDGAADLVVQTGSDVRIWAMQAGNVSSEIALPAAPSSSRVVGTGDYDGNQSADLLWENSSTGAFTLWLLNGGAVAATGTLDRSSLPSAEEWRVGGSGDFNGDGADDLMLFSRVKGEVEVWTFTGAAVASRTRQAGHVGAWSVATVDDTDGDGMAEIVWTDELARALELRDPAAASPVSLGALAAGWRARGAADLAGDGSAEVVLTQAGAGGAQAVAVDDGGVLGSSNLPTAQGLGVFAGSGDFDADGREDIAWSDASDGAVTLWLKVATAPTSVVVNRALPAFGSVVSGNTGSDDSAFRQRFCSGDLNGNGAVNNQDFKRFLSCVDKPRSARCNLADMNSDGWVDMANDNPIFQLRYTGTACEPW
jgi:VCBS repeat protein